MVKKVDQPEQRLVSDVSNQELRAALRKFASQTARDDVLERAGLHVDTELVATLERLATLTVLGMTIAQEIDETALQAKEQGASWATIAKAVGTTPQSAHQRWAKRQRTP